MTEIIVCMYCGGPFDPHLHEHVDEKMCEYVTRLHRIIAGLVHAMETQGTDSYDVFEAKRCFDEASAEVYVLPEGLFDD